MLSDGIFEAGHHETGELYGVERVCEMLDKHRALSPAELLVRLREAMIEWQGKEEPALLRAA